MIDLGFLLLFYRLKVKKFNLTQPLFCGIILQSVSYTKTTQTIRLKIPADVSSPVLTDLLYIRRDYLIGNQITNRAPSRD